MALIYASYISENSQIDRSYTEGLLYQKLQRDKGKLQPTAHNGLPLKLQFTFFVKKFPAKRLR
jgi:hypothetical protein